MPDRSSEYQVHIVTILRDDPAGADLSATAEQIAAEMARIALRDLLTGYTTPDKITVRNMNTGDEFELDPQEVMHDAE